MEYVLEPYKLDFGAGAHGAKIDREELAEVGATPVPIDERACISSSRKHNLHSEALENQINQENKTGKKRSPTNRRSSRQGSPLSDINECLSSPGATLLFNSSQTTPPFQTSLTSSPSRAIDAMNIESQHTSMSSVNSSHYTTASDFDSQSASPQHLPNRLAGNRTTSISPVTINFQNRSTSSSMSQRSEDEHNSDFEESHDRAYLQASPVMSMEENSLEETETGSTNAGEAAPSEPAQEPPSDLDAEAASIALARQLMQEESMMVYQQMQEEALRLQQAMAASADGTQASNEDDSDLMYALELARQEQVMEEGGIEDDSLDPDEMDYEALMELGEQMGDVAQDRWRMDAPKIIETLPVQRITKEFLSQVEGNQGMCQVCQCDYEEGEEMKILPCKHHFHPECIDRWLQDHPTCCICKRNVVEAAEEEEPDDKLPAAAIAGGNRIVRSPSA